MQGKLKVQLFRSVCRRLNGPSTAHVELGFSCILDVEASPCFTETISKFFHVRHEPRRRSDTRFNVLDGAFVHVVVHAHRHFAFKAIRKRFCWKTPFTEVIRSVPNLNWDVKKSFGEIAGTVAFRFVIVEMDGPLVQLTLVVF